MMIWALWQDGLLNLSYTEGMICNLWPNYLKRKQIVKHPELLVTGNVTGDVAYTLCYCPLVSFLNMVRSGCICWYS